MKLTITEVINYANEDIVKAESFFAQDIDHIFEKRYELEKAIQLNAKIWVCPFCRQPVKIRGKKYNRIKSMHFAHVADNLDCPIKTGKNYSKDQILRMKYNGQKESPRHYKLKNLIAAKMFLDDRFSQVKVDSRFEGVCMDWRKPDVSAIFNGKKIAVEIQLSTTFLNVIVERNMFYQQNETYILWIFSNERKNIEDMRFSEMDIFYPNHHNAFYLEEGTNEKSFKLICGYEEPIIENGILKNIWKTTEIDFDKLTFANNYQLYWFDYDAKKNALKEELESQKLIHFENSWLEVKTYDDWNSLTSKYDDLLKKISIDLNWNELSDILNCLYSLKQKKVIGYKYAKVIQLLHQYFSKEVVRESHFGELILRAISVYGVRDQILSEDKTHKFREKAKRYKNLQFEMSHKYDKLLKYLFPELWKTK